MFSAFCGQRSESKPEMLISVLWVAAGAGNKRKLKLRLYLKWKEDKENEGHQSIVILPA